MGLLKINIGTNEDGTARYHYSSNHPNQYHPDTNPDTEAVGLVYTGPHITGSVTLPDGTVYDVNEHFTEVPLKHHGELDHAIGLRFEAEGHPLHDVDAPFLHHCTAKCGPDARPVTDPMATVAAARAQAQTSAIVDAAVRAHHAEAMGTSAGDTASMALASVTAENAALNGLDGTGATNVIPDVSLHTATTSTTGAAENANSGSYARQACTWNAGSSGAKTNSTALTFATLGTIAVAYIGTWSSATYGAGNFAIGGALASSVTAASITIASGAISISAS